MRRKKSCVLDMDIVKTQLKLFWFLLKVIWETCKGKFPVLKWSIMSLVAVCIFVC